MAEQTRSDADMLGIVNRDRSRDTISEQMWVYRVPEYRSSPNDNLLVPAAIPKRRPVFRDPKRMPIGATQRPRCRQRAGRWPSDTPRSLRSAHQEAASRSLRLSSSLPLGVNPPCVTALDQGTAKFEPGQIPQAQRGGGTKDGYHQPVAIANSPVDCSIRRRRPPH
jgi:hypothetical protein